VGPLERPILVFVGFRGKRRIEATFFALQSISFWVGAFWFGWESAVPPGPLARNTPASEKGRAPLRAQIEVVAPG